MAGQCKITETFSLSSEIRTGHVVEYRNYCTLACHALYGIWKVVREERIMQHRYRGQHVAESSSGGPEL